MAGGMVRLSLCLTTLLLVGWASAVDIGAACDDDNKCEILGASCNADLCKCLDGYTPSADNKQCNQEIIGGVCLESAQCLVDLSECTGEDGSKKCACEAKHVATEDNKKCLPEATSIDGVCEISAQCSASFENSECKDLKCKCLDTHVENSMKDKCLIIVTDFDTVCEEPQQCSTGIANTECSGTGNDKKCKCSTGYIQNSTNDGCLKTADLVGDSCTAADPEVCSSIENAACTNNKCTCKDGFVSSLDKSKCLTVAGETLNDDCVESQQCTESIMHTECVKQKCKCSMEYVAALNSKSCLEKSYFNETCSEPQQCTDLTPGSIDCIGEVCKCKPENHFAETQCWQDRKLGQPCSTKLECVLSNDEYERVECKGGTCQCTADSISNVDANTCSSGVTNTIAIISMSLVFTVSKLF